MPKLGACSSNQLARQLKGFASPTPVRIGAKTAKGYHVSVLERAFDRYLPPFPNPNRHTETYGDDKGLNSNFKPKQTTQSFALKDEVTPSSSMNVSVCHFEGGDITAGDLERQHPDLVTQECSSEPVAIAGSIGLLPDDAKKALPSCPACGSYYLRPSSDGSRECQTCGGSMGVC